MKAKPLVCIMTWFGVRCRLCLSIRSENTCTASHETAKRRTPTPKGDDGRPPLPSARVKPTRPRRRDLPPAGRSAVALA